MRQALCIEKNRDIENRITSYTLTDESGHISIVEADYLKSAIRSGRLDVLNLKLTTDNRLIDKEFKDAKRSEVYVQRDMIENLDLTNKTLTYKSNVNLESFKAKAQALGIQIARLKDDVYMIDNGQSVVIFTDKQFYFAENAVHMFSKLILKSLNIKGIDASKLTNMAYMFSESKINTLDLSGLNTTNVRIMHGLFRCSDVYYLKLKGFDTSRVNDMGSMFEECVSKEIDLSTFNTSNVTNMQAMFKNCSTDNLDIRYFNTSKVSNMSDMFYGFNTEKLDLRHFDTSKVEHMYSMFERCKAKEINVSSFNTRNVRDMAYMFSECSVRELDLSSFETMKVENFKEMFSGSTKLRQLNISNFRLNEGLYPSTENMFKGTNSMKIKADDKTIKKIFGKI